VKANIATHGFPDWHGWRIHHVGTKGNLDEHTAVECQEPSFVRYRFDTAWSPPLAWLKAVARTFPALSFELRYEEGGCDFTGRLCIENGDETHNECRDLWGRRTDDDGVDEAFGFISDPECEYA